jgi:hypothetical protein|tara:strand:+ start:4517 stop:5440 length:924 start_codon:yes stop_codon:yes gene_type:complete
MITYTLDQFTDIGLNLNKHILPDDVLSVYDKLLKDLNINTRTVEYEQREKRYKRQKNNKPELLSSGKVVEFKQKEVVVKTDYEKIMINIRASLNKLSSKNYDTQTELLRSYLDELSSLNDESYFMECSNYLFDVASKNKFYSEMYANLYVELSKLYPIFEERKEQFIIDCIEGLDTITYIDETQDYEGFCKNNKQNDIRRSMNTFLIHLYKKKQCNIQCILKMTTAIFDKIEVNKNTASQVHVIEELTENLYIFISELIREFKQHTSWDIILNNLTEYTNIKVSDYPGLTTRIKFKFMDMMDIVKKK